LANAFTFRDGEHFFGKIRADDFSLWHFSLQGEREIPCARGKIDNPEMIGAREVFRSFIWLPTRHDFRNTFSPIEIDAAAKEMIGQVVTRRD
jgi:hypothetical protein